MKIQLDTIAKVIKVDESINLGEFFKAIKDLLPNDMWKEYKLETNTVINWGNPYVVYPYPTYNPYPWWTPTTIDTGDKIGGGSWTTVGGIYCIEF